MNAIWRGITSCLRSKKSSFLLPIAAFDESSFPKSVTARTFRSNSRSFTSIAATIRSRPVLSGSLFAINGVAPRSDSEAPQPSAPGNFALMALIDSADQANLPASMSSTMDSTQLFSARQTAIRYSFSKEKPGDELEGFLVTLTQAILFRVERFKPLSEPEKGLRGRQMIEE